MAKLEDHDEKLEELLTWRYKLAGATMILSLLGGVAVQLLLQKFN